MPKSRMIMIVGVCIALLPMLGFPRAWESFFQVFAGLSIVLLTTWSAIDRKLTLKAKAQQRMAKKVSPSPDSPEPFESSQDNQAGGAAKPNSPGRRITDFYPKTAPPGRRAADLKPTLSEDQPREENQEF